MKNRTILIGDVLEKLKEIPPESIDCVITSPPYWGLRDYGVDGQWGLEADFKQYLEKMRQMMNCLRIVLKKTGTCWINLGDTYAGGIAHFDFKMENSEQKKYYSDNSIRERQFKGQEKNQLQTKSRFGIPERFYVQCIDDGWIARNHIVWSKANSMPSSVKDRFTNKWESLFFFAKQQKYYFNLDAVREKTVTDTKPFNIRVRENKTGHAQAKLGELSWKASDEELETHNEKGERKWSEVDGQTPQTIADKHYGNYDVDGNNLNNPAGKNPGDVFKINPRPFPEAHFATFPIDLPLKILKCACPTDGICLDPFFGAGTVGVAAEQLGLNWCGIELKEDYIKIARKRLSPYQNERLN